MTTGHPFVSTPVGALDTARRVAVLAAESWGLPDPVLVRASMNVTFSCGDVVLRIGRTNASATLGIRLLERLSSVGIRVPIPCPQEPLLLEGLSVTALRRLSPVERPIDWADVGRMVAVLHRVPAADLVPLGYPLVDPIDLPWWDLAGMFEGLEAEDDVERIVDAPSRRALRDAVTRSRDWSEHIRSAPSVVCHGDLHPGNVMMTAEGPVVLDWDLLASAPVIWDHVPLFAMAGPWGGDRRWYDDFARGYGVDLAGSAPLARLAEARDLAATLMKIRAAQHDPTAAAEARLRLAHWRGERSAPRWTAS